MEQMFSLYRMTAASLSSWSFLFFVIQKIRTLLGRCQGVTKAAKNHKEDKGRYRLAHNNGKQFSQQVVIRK
jgi:hypothetical protein